MDIIHHKILIVLVICFDIVNNILKEIVAWSALPPLAAAIITITIFLFTATFVFFLLALIFCFNKVKCGAFWGWTLQIVAVLAYYCGDNIPFILHKYGHPLNCHASCQSRSRSAAIVLLVISLLIQYSIPQKQHNKQEVQENRSKYRRQWWIYALNIATVFFNIDIIYTAITLSILHSEYFISTNISVFVSGVIVGWFSTAMNFWYSQNSLEGCENKKKIHDKPFAFTSFILAIGLPLYLLSDNEQPLDWNLGCQFNATSESLEEEYNTYEPEYDCSNPGHHFLRLVVPTLSAAAILLTLLLLLCRWLKERNHDHQDEDSDEVNLTEINETTC